MITWRVMGHMINKVEEHAQQLKKKKRRWVDLKKQKNNEQNGLPSVQSYPSTEIVWQHFKFI